MFRYDHSIVSWGLAGVMILNEITFHRYFLMKADSVFLYDKSFIVKE